MPTTTELPHDVAGCLDAHSLNHRPILLSTASDISLGGDQRRHWLVVTKDHLSVVAERVEGVGGRAEGLEPFSTGSSDLSGTRDGTDPIPLSSAPSALSHSALGPSPSLIHAIPVADIQSVRTWAGIGSGLLQVKTNDTWVDLLRYSNALADRFHKVSRKLETFRTDGELVIHEGEVLDAHRCPTCQLRLNTTAETCPRCLHRDQILSRVGDILRPQMTGAIALCLLTVLGVAAELVPPKLQQYMVDNVLTKAGTIEGQAGDQTQFFTALLVVVLALAASRVMLSVVGVFKGKLATTIGSNLTHRLRAEMVQKLQKLTIAYYDRHQVGSLMSRVAYDSEVLHGLVHQFTGGFLLQIVQLIGVGAMLLWLNFKLAIYTLIPVPLVFLGTWYFWRHVYPRYYRLWDSSSKQIAALSGMLSGIRVVKAFAQEQREMERFEKSSAYLKDSRLWVENATSVYSGMMQLVFSLGGLIVWYVGGRDVIGQDMTLGELIAFLAYLAMFYAPLGALSNFTTWLTSFLTGSKRVLELLDTPITIGEPDKPADWPEVKGEIRFENVTFGYDRHTPVLHGVTFDVKPGEMVGFVGRSGSGKTTLVNLLGRFYDVQEGRILVDGHDIRDLSMSQLRQNLGIVFQESFMFRGTIWDNLSYGRPQTTIEEGLAAAKAAGAHDFICRAQLGYETPLGEQGAGLSGGEKQRLSIARTLLYDPKILVLDEATSNIDAEAERAIQQALEVLVKGRTTIAIAHRLSTLRNADRIIVFDRGRLVEQGSHAELLEQDGVYARLVRIQTQFSKGPSIDKLVAEQTEQRAGDVSPPCQPGKQSSTATTVTTVAAPASPTEPEALAPGADKHLIKWLTPGTCIVTLGKNGELVIAPRSEALLENASSGGSASPRVILAHSDREAEPPIPDVPKQSLGTSEHPLPLGPSPSALAPTSAFVVCTFPATHPEKYLSVRGWDAKGDEVEIGLIADLSVWPTATQTLIRRSLSRRYLFRRISRIHSLALAHGFLEFDVDTDRGRKQFTMRWSQSQAQDFGPTGKLLSDTEDNRYVVTDVDTLPTADRIKFRQHIYW